MIKRSIDLSFLIIGFTLLMPILLIVILVVVIFLFFEDGYPIFYTQDRYAKNKKKFKLFKFRSMIKNAEQQTGAIWASKEDDPRLTKTGKFIRKYAIDEIPQLINILRGDISIVGPRHKYFQIRLEFPWYPRVICFVFI